MTAATIEAPITTATTTAPVYTPERLISIRLIEPNPGQPRKFFEVEALEELATSIRQFGVLQPIVVRRTGRQAYVIIAGERRFRASQLAGLDRIPCRVIESISDEEAYILSVTENVNRRDMRTMEEARAYAAIIELGRTPAEVGAIFGKKDWYVSWRVDLLNLREDLADLVDRGQLNMNLARALSRLSLNGQASVMSRYNAGQFATADLAARYAAVVAAQEAQADMFEQPATDLLEEAARGARRAKLTGAWDKLGTGRLAEALDTFLEMSPEQLATALGPDTSVYADRFEHLKKSLGKVTAAMAQASAIHMATVR